MTRISPQDVDHIAALARISLKKDEAAKYARELASILAYIADLGKTKTEGVMKIEQISGLRNVTREDRIETSLSTKKVLENAPDEEDSFIKVKKIFE